MIDFREQRLVNTIKLPPVIYLVGLSSIALALAFMISPNNHSVLAQQSNSSNNKTISITMTPNTQQQQNPYSMLVSL
jgi:hypothetical protein